MMDCALAKTPEIKKEEPSKRENKRFELVLSRSELRRLTSNLSAGEKGVIGVYVYDCGNNQVSLHNQDNLDT